jgi:hypothetical protein
MLSAWFRMKYPNVVVGALAGSAPIMQFQGSPNNFDPSAFNAIITQDFEQAVAGSSDKVREAFTQILSMGTPPCCLSSSLSSFRPLLYLPFSLCSIVISLSLLSFFSPHTHVSSPSHR